ncbi:hypothetical protein M2317_003444 [Microbacterium sp. ZKA21]|uniref:hypothetical protein n=1 Tax=Microbacterium sp. ZKA21 TaxID=3381694 RepID=UPI003D1EE5C6
MTAASIQHTAPTRLEVALLHIADALTAYVGHRRDVRAERRSRELAQLRDTRPTPPDPRALDIALLKLGSRPR